MQRLILILICMVVIRPWGIVFATELFSETRSTLQAGNDAFEKTDYVSAIELYLQAYRQGDHSAILFHNLGVAFYKNANYIEAHAVFTRLSHVENFRAVAGLNLALVAIKQEQWGEARLRLLSIRKMSATAIVQTNADKLLLRVERQIADLRSIEAAFFLFSSTGYEDNAQSFNGRSQTQSASNYFSDLNIYVTKFLGRIGQSDIRLSASAYGLKNTEKVADDLYFAMFGLETEFALGPWKRQWIVTLNRVGLNGKAYQSGVELAAVFKYQTVAGADWEVMYKFQNLVGVDTDDKTLDTLTHLVRLGILHQYGRVKYKTEFEIEDNKGAVDRVDDFTPLYAPMRLKMRLESRIAHRYRWYSLYRYEYRQSMDKLFNGTERQDNRQRILLRWGKEIMTAVDVGLEYEYRKQDSNIELYNYDRNAITLQLNWQY